ncbi:hypothetical protein M4951_16515 [Blastopirellula sp. J2-11]|uniref:hypothetical protein n=1 Tax=Blastopirellula sp. J2-11 TaxID=2943192 RepID=UPI0021C9E80C|nr:hypothetical protein [Blastopirellula sp. J2-11]UUO04983.1 hypothetical protein M4951_16515 [Blastopirellula sp. J2-11]
MAKQTRSGQDPATGEGNGWLVAVAIWLEGLFARRNPSAESFQEVWLSSEPHLQRIADKFFSRGKRQNFTANILLCVAIVLVFIGMLAFLYPTNFSDASSGEIDNRLEELRRDLREISEQETDIEQRLVTQSQVRAGLAPFNELKNFLFNLSSAGKLAEQRPGDTVSQRFVDTKQLLVAIQTPPEKYSLDLRNYSYTGSQPKRIEALSMQSLLALRTTIEAGGINVPTLTENVEKLSKSVGSPMLADQALFASAYEDLEVLAKAFQSEEDAIAELQRQVDALGQVATQRQQKKEELQQEIAQVLAIRELEHAAGVNLQSWIPVLSVRVGVVILLLFLVQILLATYRYSMSLGAFFTARGDAMQLVSAGAGNELMNREQLKELVQVLAPDQLKIDPVVSPDQIIAKAVAREGS